MSDTNILPGAVCPHCKYVSIDLPEICPSCGDTTTPDRLASETDAAGNHMPDQIAKWTGVPQDPAGQARNLIKTLRFMKILCGTLALCVFLLIVPLYIVPIMKGPNSYGWYKLPKTRKTESITLSPQELQVGLILILISSALLTGGFFYFKRKQEDAN